MRSAWLVLLHAPRSMLKQKGRGQRICVNRGLRYFKRPVDCDDEESLEERRGRTVLRTAM